MKETTFSKKRETKPFLRFVKVFGDFRSTRDP